MNNSQDDPTDARAKERSRLGLSREEQTLRTNHENNPTSGSKGVSLQQRCIILNYAMEYSDKAAAEKFDCSERSIQRWKNRVEPLQMTGNRERHILVGLDQLLLTMSVYLYPSMNSDERAAFIYANGGSVSPYSRQDVSRRCKELGITLKKRSIEAYQAFTHTNRLKKELFFARGPRLGIRGVRRFRLIDTDEAQFSLVKVETKKGWGYKTQRIREAGHYTRSAATVSLIMSVEAGNPYLPPHMYGSIQNPRKWWKITTDSMNQYVFANYMDYVLSSIENDPVPGGYDNDRVLLWDNLSVHKTTMVATMVQLRPRKDEFRFISINRPPYQPNIAPIEYIFGMIGMQLSQRCAKDWGLDRLVEEIHYACVHVGLDGSLDNTFIHCGYVY